MARELAAVTAGRKTVKDNEELSALLDELERDEGYVPHAYPDSRGFLTIGIGRMVDKRLKGGVTREEARYLATNDIRRCHERMDAIWPWWRKMTPNRRRALTNMCFNLGTTRLIKFKKMLRHLEVGEYAEAAFEALNSQWAQQVGERAERIAAMLQEG